MNVNDFDFNLPKELIAQIPLKNRSDSKLLVVNRTTKQIKHYKFNNIVDLIDDNSVLVINDTKVIPARIIGEKLNTGAVVELLLLNELEALVWQALVKPAKRVKVGTIINFGAKLQARCTKVLDEGIREFELIYDGILYEILDELGTMPLPPYITEKLPDKERYQTVYATNLGSVAAPTAGLHFTKEILTKLEAKGVEIVKITLHVGLGTFRPIKVDNVFDHQMHREYYEISKTAASTLNAAKRAKKKIVSVGTTSTRTLESNYQKFNEFKEYRGTTDIFIYPGYKFVAIDELITNFHLPKSTLIMLVSAFANQELIFTAYETAIAKEYRFFSFGDSMYLK